MNSKATQQLKDEHEGIKIMLGIMGRISGRMKATGNVNKEDFGGILEFLKVFVDRCHHGKEEDLLFPALEAAGVPKDGPIAVMLREHTMGRAYVKTISEAFDAYTVGDGSSSGVIIENVEGYISLLNAHMEKENTVLFVMADRLLPEKRQDELFEGFEQIEVERIGIGKHEEFHSLLKKLSKIYSD